MAKYIKKFFIVGIITVCAMCGAQALQKCGPMALDGCQIASTSDLRYSNSWQGQCFSDPTGEITDVFGIAMCVSDCSTTDGVTCDGGVTLAASNNAICVCKMTKPVVSVWFRNTILYDPISPADCNLNCSMYCALSIEQNNILIDYVFNATLVN